MAGLLSPAHRAMAEGRCALHGHRWGPAGPDGARECRLCEMSQSYFLAAPSPSRTAMMVYAQPVAPRVARPVPEPVFVDPEPRGWSVPWLLVIAMVAALAVVRIGALL